MVTTHYYIPEGHPNRPGKKLLGLYSINFHYTANDAPTADALVNARWFSRGYVKIDDDYYEKDRVAKFRYGSTQVICDMNQVVQTMPLNEVSWAVGDRPLEYTEQFKGQKPLAKHLFNNKQNYYSLNVEICNNNAIPGNNLDWEGSCKNAILFVVDFLQRHHLKARYDSVGDPKPIDGTVWLLRHYDITGKLCPKPFCDDTEMWLEFCREICDKVN